MTNGRNFFDASKRKPVPERVGLATPLLFASAVTLLVAEYDWLKPLAPFRLSASDLASYPIFLYETLLATLHLAYAVAATSWLLYWVFLVYCYPLIFLTCLFQFHTVARFVRKRLCSLLQQLYFNQLIQALFVTFLGRYGRLSLVIVVFFVFPFLDSRLPL